MVGPITFQKKPAKLIFTEKPEEQFDREDFSSFVDTSPRGTLSRMDSLTTLAQMSWFNKINPFKIYFILESMAEEVHQMNLTAADSPASPPPSYSCKFGELNLHQFLIPQILGESLSSCLKSSPIAFGTQPFASGNRFSITIFNYSNFYS